MIPSHRALALISASVGCFAALSCARLRPAPAPVEIPRPVAAIPDAPFAAPMTIAASADTNPDATGRPSPVVVRIYQLRTDVAFRGADFFPLFDDDKMVLGSELISREEFVLAPEERRAATVTLSGETRFVGAVAAFRDIRNAQWRVLVPASRNALTVAVERARVVLSVVVN